MIQTGTFSSELGHILSRLYCVDELSEILEVEFWLQETFEIDLQARQNLIKVILG